MRWRSGRRSQNVEDRRSSGGGFGGFGGLGKRSGGGGGLSSLLPLILGLVGKKFGFTAVLVVGAIAWFMSGDLGKLLGGGGMQPGMLPAGESRTSPSSEVSDELGEFVSVVLGDTEDTWKALFAKMGQTYREPKLVLYKGSTRSACGYGQAAMGPFYCPGDQKVYIDLSFYNDLRNRFRAPGDFAQAYVIAHEVGHHVQTLLGISPQVRKAQQRMSEAESNEMSVRQELQADCFSGVWAHHAHKARNILEKGDIAEALNAATAIGDDRMQQRSKGYVTPDSFTHGSSEQRVRWFRKGIETGDLKACDTFSESRI
jgi:predicted metalloprotease